MGNEAAKRSANEETTDANDALALITIADIIITVFLPAKEKRLK